MNSALFQKWHYSKTEQATGFMDTSVRPKKRKRVTSNVLGKSTGTLQFLRRFGSSNMHEHSDSNYESVVSEMLSYLEASAISIDASTARKLHKIFLVNIGFSLKLQRMDQALLLAKCLHALYCRTCIYLGEKNGLKSAENFFGKHEIEEAFVIILQGLEGLNEENPLRLAISFRLTCLQIIHQLTFLSPRLQRVLDVTPGSKVDQIFYIKCLLISGAPEKCTEDTRLHGAIPFSENTCLEENYLSAAVEFFCLMVDSWRMTNDLIEFFELIVEVLLERSKLNDASTKVSVKCFQKFIGTLSARRMLLDSRAFDSVVQFLLDVVFDEPECEDTLRQATDVLCALAMALQVSRASQVKEQCDPYRLLSSLLSSDNQAVLSKTISSAHRLLIATDGTGIKHDYSRNFVSLLAEAALRGFGPKATQHEVVEIFQLLVKKNDAYLNFLTRQPFAVSLIVHVAFSETCIAPPRRAFSLLFRMSKDPCNHRIMARQPGLLSAFFRYARSVSNTDDQREKTKERILCLVKAL